jgi:hypothetical protein
MANIIAPFGFREFRRLDGGAPTAGFDTLVIASSDTNFYFTGDPVVTAGAGSGGGNYITTPSTFQSFLCRGIFKGCEYYSATVGRKVWSPFFANANYTSSGTNDVLAWVITDPEMLFIVQTSTALGSAITSSYIGSGFGISSQAGYLSSQGNTTTGISVVALGSTGGSAVTNSSATFRLWDLWSNWVGTTGNFNYSLPGTNAVVNGTDNTSAGNIVIVAPNNWDRKNNAPPA